MTRWAQTEHGERNHLLILTRGKWWTPCGLVRSAWYPPQPGGKCCALCLAAKGPNAVSPP